MRPLSPNIPLAWTLLALLCYLLQACSGGSSAPPPAVTPSAAVTLTPPVPEPTATPQPEDMGEGSVELIHRALLSIVNYHIDKPDPLPLLQAAWQGAAAAAGQRGVPAPPLSPLPPGLDAMWLAWRDQYLDLLHALPPDALDDLRFAAIASMAKSLDDCHTFYLSPQRSGFIDVHEGRATGGVGVELAPSSPPYVRDIYSGSPAEQAGLLPGDVLLAVDGQDVAGLDVIAVDALLRGPPGSQAEVRIRRPSTGVTSTVLITRALVRTPAVDYRVLDDGTGYIKIRAFTVGTEVRDGVRGAIDDFEARGVSGWVIDLRDNGGGDSDLVLDGYFIGREVAERTILRDGVLETNDGQADPLPDRPLAVLVNGGSASVSEIFASMLQDYGRARVFGTVTQQCAGFVSLEQFPDGSTLGVTIAHALSPRSEQPLWRTGVVPDQFVVRTQADLVAGRDPVLDAATAWLRSVTGR
jgi:carboxyl-terminal processing protease